MTPATPGSQGIIHQTHQGEAPGFGDISSFSPADLRMAIQALVAEDNMDLAQALADAGISLHPLSEDMLAIASLLAMAQAQWPLAIELINDLCELQQGAVQPTTYQMLARSHWCNLDLAEASRVLVAGLQIWPDNRLLLDEQVNMALASNALPASLTRN
jgi:hypothetical protein